ncbi:MAG: hypothetical protein KC621_22105, partial [Myxococcales bacterium]|nr:hypothetical protein [Myxococcales bacterium]
MVGISWLALLACSGGPVPHTDVDDTGTPSGDDDDDDVTIPPVREDQGSLVVSAFLPWADVEQPSTLMTGVFVESRRNWINLAQCVSMPQAWCMSTEPKGPYDSIEVQDYDPSLIDDLATRYVGTEVALGPLVAPAARIEEQDKDYYFQGWDSADLPTGELGLHLSGEWGPYDGTADVIAPDPMVVTGLDPMTINEIYDSGPMHLTWEPGTNGDVYLLVDTPVERRLWRLDDTGSFDLDLAPYQLPDRTRVDLMLMRWGRGFVDHSGDEVDVIVQSIQPIRGLWRSIGGRAELTELYDECAEAETAASVQPGFYFAELSGYAADMDPTAQGCTTFSEPGNDGIIPVDLPAHTLLHVNFALPSQDSALYLLSDCNRPRNACLVGADEGLTGDNEEIQYLNDTEDPVRVYIVLDSFRRIQSVGYVDFTITPVGGDILHATCVDAMDAGPIDPGTYTGSIAGYADLLDPQCVANTTGGEGLAQISLLPDQTLTATVTAAGNPTL